MQPNPKKLAIIVQGSSYDKLHLMATLVATAVSMNGEAHLFLTYDALNRYVHETLDEAKPSLDDEKMNERYQSGVEDGRIPSITELLRQAKEMGQVKVYGCSQSVAFLRLDPKLTEKLDGVVGYTTFMTSAMDAKLIIL
ncbi:MAG: DsrE family protein [Candidatus Omnitrophica bacterium]|nr:DsrE family protein [Candidatus Omnitrophota bacterium]